MEKDEKFVFTKASLTWLGGASMWLPVDDVIPARLVSLLAKLVDDDNETDGGGPGRAGRQSN
jgi:hypothetical protein